jgi:hypothetical protein
MFANVYENNNPGNGVALHLTVSVFTTLEVVAVTD